MRFTLSCLAVILAVGVSSAAPPDPLSFIPKEATLVLKVEKPRQLVEAVRALDAYQGYESLPAVKAALESPIAKVFWWSSPQASTHL